MKPTSVFHRLSLTIVAGVAAAFALVAIASLGSGRAILIEHARDEIELEADQTRRVIENRLSEANRQLALTAAMLRAASPSSPVAPDAIPSEAARPPLRLILALDRDGRILASSSSADVGTIASLGEFGLATSGAGSAFLPPGEGPFARARTPTVLLSRPLDERLGTRVVGVVDWRDIAAREFTGPGGARSSERSAGTVLLDRDGRWLAGDPGLFAASPRLLEAVRATPERGAGAAPAALTHGHLLARSDLGADAPECARGWRVVRIEDAGTTLAVTRWFTAVVALSLALGLALAIVFALRASRRLSRRIARLTAATKAIARGELGHRVRDRAPDEIGQLSQALDSMSAQLAASRDDLEALHARFEEGTRLQSEFLANMSHELRTPLNSVLGHLQLVLHNLCESREEERDLQTQALEAARGLLAQINALLEFARLEAGRTRLTLEPVEVGTLLTELRLRHAAEAQSRGLDLSFETAEEDPARACSEVRVRADADKLALVMDQMMRNALKFTPRGSVRVVASLNAPQGFVLIEIVDTGVGIDTQRRSSVFESFLQADGSATRRHGGTGLGLALCRGLLERMGGAIGLESEGAGLGTRLWFTVPVWRAPVSAEAPQEISGPGSGPLVLVVEDDDAHRRALVSELHVLGCRTAEAATAERGWELTRALAPRFALLDDALASERPSSLRSGFDLAVRLLAHSRTRTVSIALVSSFPAEASARLERLALAERVPCLERPVETERLAEWLHSRDHTAPGRSLRMMLAHADPDVAGRVRSGLPPDRYELEHVRSLGAALVALRETGSAFDLLLFDASLFGDRDSMLARLREEPAARRTPWLLLVADPVTRPAVARLAAPYDEVQDVLPLALLLDFPASIPNVLDRALERGLERRARPSLAAIDSAAARTAA